MFAPDPELGLQWALSNAGQTGGTPDADLDGIEAWTLATGAGQTVAVIDTGADMDHPDLATDLRTDGVDYVDGGTIEDVSGHGSHVAGIIAAERDNGIGVAGRRPRRRGPAPPGDLRQRWQLVERAHGVRRGG